VDGQDRLAAMGGRLDEREATVGRQRRADPLCPLGDLVGRDREAEVGLDLDRVAEVARAVDDLHGWSGAARMAAATSAGR
jgi:hypothetical protein